MSVRMLGFLALRSIKLVDDLMERRAETDGLTALVVFCDQTGLWWLRLLRRGFRHCFVMVRFEAGWVLYNPLSNGTQLDVWPAYPMADVQAWLGEQGFQSLVTQIQTLSQMPWPWRPFTCVEALKRILGLKAPWALTPWQLYRVLLKNSEEGKKSLIIASV